MSDNQHTPLTDEDLALMVDPTYLNSADSEELGSDLLLVVAELLKVRQDKTGLLTACERAANYMGKMDYPKDVLAECRAAIAKAKPKGGE